MKKIAFAVLIVVSVLVGFIAMPQSNTMAVGEVRVGTYGTLSHYGETYEGDVAQWFAGSKLDWIWLQPPFPYDTPSYVYAKLLKDTGKRILLRCFFWDALGFTQRDDWTTMRRNPSKY